MEKAAAFDLMKNRGFEVQARSTDERTFFLTNTSLLVTVYAVLQVDNGHVNNVELHTIVGLYELKLGVISINHPRYEKYIDELLAMTIAAQNALNLQRG